MGCPVRLAEAKLLYEKMHTLYNHYDKSIAENIEKQKHPVSCKKGCDSCCKIMAVCTIAEAMVLAFKVLQKPDWRALLPRLRESAIQMSPIGLGEFEYAQKRLPCAFLNDGACSMYHDRPGACREAKHAAMQGSQVIFGPKGFLIGPLPLMVLHAMRMLSKKPAEQAELDAALAGMPDVVEWCEAKVKAAYPDIEF